MTDERPFAGLVLQRTLALDGDPANLLMAVVSRAACVHSHASGMALELFGAGTVLGPNAGKGRYTVVTTDGKGRGLDLYVGDGVQLEYRGATLRAAGRGAFSASVDLQEDRPEVTGRGDAVFNRSP